MKSRKFWQSILFLLPAVFGIVTSPRSSWTSWSDCSRTCGGGVSYSRRDCVTRGCQGDFKRYRTCNNEDCKNDAIDFRAQQCAVYSGVDREWVPEITSDLSPCALHCRDRNTNVVKMMSLQVLDGTRCNGDAYDICINGLCETVGCDRVLNSSAKLDVCGECEGDGSSCRLVTGLHLANQAKREGTEVVITIPKNSRRVSLSERGCGHLGLKMNHSDEFDVIMPNRSELRRPKVFETGGLKVKYGLLSYGKEYLDVDGPVLNDMQVLAVYDDVVWKYIRYEFYRPLTVFWKHDGNNAACSSTCGAGLQFIWPICVDIKTGERRDEKECMNEGISKPSPKVHRCNMTKCPSSYTARRIGATFEYVRRNRWLADPWTQCSSSCAGGFQTRTISCVEDTIHGEALITLEDSPCHEAGLEVPEGRRRCNEHPCPRWEAQVWSECSATCEQGWQHRVVRCVSHDGNAAFHCNRSEKPAVQQSCVASTACIIIPEMTMVDTSQPKPPPMKAALVNENVNSISVKPSWVSESWSECSATCGIGVATRVVKCKVLRRFTRVIEDIKDTGCEGKKPIALQPCSMGQCLANDDSGNRHDDAVVDEDYNAAEINLKVVDDFSNYGTFADNDTNTDDNENDLTPAPFHEDDLLSYEWRYRGYGACTPSCGNGTQTNIQTCFHISPGALVSADRCDQSAKLESLVRPCGSSPCVTKSLVVNGMRWDLGRYGECDVTCGRGIQTRSVVCRHMPEGGNYSLPLNRQRRHGPSKPDIMCPPPKPQERRDCSQTACEPSWVANPWSKCSRNCGRGVQQRELQCMQKLGTGETVPVPSDYCSRKQPVSKRSCNRRNCPPRYFVKAWSQCGATCGKSIKSRSVACVQILAGKMKPNKVSNRRCARLLKPKTRNMCLMPKCISAQATSESIDIKQPTKITPSRKAGPIIRTGKEIFVQSKPATKVRLQVGTLAYVLPKTTLVVKCRVEKFEKRDLRWRHKGRLIRSGTRSRVSVLADGSLRILYAKLSDSGNYTCLAASTASLFALRVVHNTSSVQHELSETSNIPENPAVVLPTTRDQTTGVDKANKRFDTSDSHSNPAPNVLHSDGSRRTVVAKPTLKVYIPEKQRTFVRKENSDRRLTAGLPKYKTDLYDPSSPLVAGRPITIMSSVVQILRDSGIEQSSDEINGLLEQLVQVTSQSKNNRTSNDERREITDHFIQKLNILMDENHDRSSESVPGNGNSAKIERLIRLLQGGLGIPASINPQPTLPPLQLKDDVVSYVGGRLIVAGAEQLTILCEASGIPQPEITWFRDGISLVNNDRQFVLSDASLRITRPQFSDAGLYKCVASNSLGNDTLTTELSVTQVPHILSTTSTLEDFASEVIEVTVGSNIRAKLGAKIKIMCPTEGYPDPYVVWRKDGPGFHQNAKFLADNSVEIFPATEADQGLFGCEATNPAGSDYQASSLVLIDPPHVSEELSMVPDNYGVVGLPELLMTAVETENYKVKTNTSVMMGCPVTGFPEPTITWYFNEQPLIELGARLDYQLMHQDKVVQIPNVGADTNGVYSCRAQNDGGNLTTSLDLKLIVYSYGFGEFTPCSVSCGDGGIQYRRLRCLENGINEVDVWYCTGLTRPVLTMQPCNQVDCPPRFVSGPWGRCSASCGNGTRTRASSCVIIMFDGTSREVAAETCLQNHTQPALTEICHEGDCPRWIPQPWRPCSRKCLRRGIGGRTRRVSCVANNGTKLHGRFCNAALKPRRKSLCPNPHCEPIWIASRWSRCSKLCGTGGVKIRKLRCVYRGRPKQSAGNQCSVRRAPRRKLPCNRGRTCPAGMPSRQPSSSRKGSCVNRYRWCPLAKRKGKCRSYKKVCCKSCS